MIFNNDCLLTFEALETIKQLCHEIILSLLFFKTFKQFSHRLTEFDKRSYPCIRCSHGDYLL